MAWNKHIKTWLLNDDYFHQTMTIYCSDRSITAVSYSMYISCHGVSRYFNWTVKAIFHYAIWFEPDSNQLRTSSEPASNQLRNSSEWTSV